MKLEKGLITHEAYKVYGKYFQCFPRGSNKRDGTEKRFKTVEEAAVFIVQNPEWQIQVNPSADIHSNGLVISRDDHHGL
ncbi:hypothetical protein [Tateyamaria sp.]|uniref:hypothetical protein n=1 Tax=Tateyamaria sp. TaxID=1929288 RepID=UPI00329C360C